MCKATKSNTFQRSWAQSRLEMPCLSFSDPAKKISLDQRIEPSGRPTCTCIAMAYSTGQLMTTVLHFRQSLRLFPWLTEEMVIHLGRPCRAVMGQIPLCGWLKNSWLWHAKTIKESYGAWHLLFPIADRQWHVVLIALSSQLLVASNQLKKVSLTCKNINSQAPRCHVSWALSESLEASDASTWSILKLCLLYTMNRHSEKNARRVLFQSW
jgi:hypothetical protein